MRTQRAGTGLLVCFLLLIAVSLAPAAGAQGEPDIAIRLLRQTPWNGPEEPVFEVAISAINSGSAPLPDLSLVLTLGSASRSRSGYEASLIDGPTTSIALRPSPLEGTLEPGVERTFSASMNLSTIDLLSTSESLIYPLAVELRSADLPVANLNTALIYLWQQPEVPLSLQWTFELSAPNSLGPSGRFVDDALEVAVSPAGRIHSEVAALDLLAAADRPTPVTVVVAPLLLDQLQQMADGYMIGERTVKAGEGGAQHASAMLATLKRVAAAPSIEIVAEPFASPSLPAMLSSGLAKDLPLQEARGRALVSDVFGVDPSSTLARAPGGNMDDATVSHLTAQGALVLLGDATTVQRPEHALGFAPPPTGALSVAGGEPVAVILPDPSVQTLLTSAAAEADPILICQQVLGELASIWKESPGVARGVAIYVPASIPAGAFIPLVRRIAAAPFLQPMSAARMASEVPPLAQDELAAPSTATFTQAYAEAIKRERRDVEALSSMLIDPGDLIDRLETNLLYAEAGAFVGDEPAGRAFVDEASAITSAAFIRATPDTSQVFTLTSRTGTIPVLLGDPGETPLKIIVKLQSVGLTFPEGDSQEVELTQPDQVLTFPVEVSSSGSITVQVLVQAPSGRVVSQSTLVVRSTAYNRVALIVTLVAGAALILLWSRRFFRRPAR